MGPVPTHLEKIVDEMENKDLISVKKIEEHPGYLPTEVYRCNTEPDISIFNEEEKKMLDRIIVQYGHLTGKQLEELSHAEAPYIGTEAYKEIPYELAFYRGTDFNDI